jgi:hypothetical protein
LKLNSTKYTHVSPQHGSPDQVEAISVGTIQRTIRKFSASLDAAIRRNLKVLKNKAAPVK